MVSASLSATPSHIPFIPLPSTTAVGHPCSSSAPRMCFKYISELPFYPHLLPSFNVPSLSDRPPQTKLSPGMSCTSLIQFSPLFLTCSWKTCSKAPFFMRTTLQHCLNPTPPHFGMSCFFSHVLRA